jgi:serine/threonine protein kinase
MEDPDDPRAGRIVGTADYLSPEHITSPSNLSPASDVYSLGCTLYYAVTGKVPFPGGTSRDKARRHREETPINPRRFNLELTDDFIDVIAAMMDKDPRKRIATAEGVVERLLPWALDAVAPDATGRPIAPVSGGLRPILPSVSDTQPGLFDDLSSGHDESPSQVSQRTDPLASADLETIPDMLPTHELIPDEPEYSWTLALAVLVPLLVASGLLVASLVLTAMR